MASELGRVKKIGPMSKWSMRAVNRGIFRYKMLKHAVW